MKKILGIVLAFFITAMAILTSAVFLKPVFAATGYKKTVSTVTTVGSSKTISELTAKDEYKVRDSFYSLTDSSVNRMASEHFQIIWGNGDTTGTVNTEFVKGNLINLENIRAFYINELGMKDVTTSTTGAISGKYKLNLYISATGLTQFTDDWAYMSADYEGFSYLFVAPGAMRVDEPSWVLPHELAHAFTYHQGGQVPGTWYESMANWFRDQYLGSTYYAYGDNVYGPTSDFFTPYMTSADCYVPHMLNWYDTWPIFLYITENPDNIDGLGLDLMHKILEEGDSSTSMYTTIEKFSGVSIKTILAGMSKRMATMDFERQDSYLKHLNEEALTVDGNYAKIYTTLNAADSQGYQSVPSDRAPMQTGFNIIPLTDADFSKGSINIDFVNTSTASEADFRATIVTANAANETRYSNTVSNGTASINLKGDETKAYLVVCATPDEIKDFTVDANSKSTDASTRYTYKVKITYSDKKAETTTEATTQTSTEKETEAPTEKATEKATEGTASGAINITQDTITVKAGQTVSFDTVSDGDYYFEINNAGWWFEPVNGFVDVWNSHYNHIMINNKTNTFSINTWCGLSDGYTFTITAYTADGKNSDTVKVVVTK